MESDPNREAASGPETEKLPISDFFELLDQRVYVRTNRRIVALCVVKSKFRTELKLYEWVWKGEGKGWRVGLANINVEGINLKKIAADAEELAKAHGIALRWSAP
jgi:hypothetical protein